MLHYFTYFGRKLDPQSCTYHILLCPCCFDICRHIQMSRACSCNHIWHSGRSWKPHTHLYLQDRQTQTVTVQHRHAGTRSQRWSIGWLHGTCAVEAVSSKALLTSAAVVWLYALTFSVFVAGEGERGTAHVWGGAQRQKWGTLSEEKIIADQVLTFCATNRVQSICIPLCRWGRCCRDILHR